MPTNDERRRVAESLRCADDYPGRPMQYMEQFILQLREIIYSDVLCDADYHEMFHRLADLIDPDTTTDTTNPDSDTTKGVESDAFDREALIALADEMDGWDVSDMVKGIPGLWADTIREALGAVE